MSDFIGLWRINGRAVEQSELDALARLMDGRDIRPPRFWRSGSIGLVHRQHWFTPEDMDEAMPLSSRSGRVLVADCRLGARDDLARSLGISLRNETDGELIGAAVDRWGPGGVPRLIGEFAFASWDPGSQSLLLARDHAGYKTLYLHRSTGCVAFSTRLRPLLGIADIPDTLDERAMADFMILNHGRPERTLYGAIDRVPMGHFALVTRERTDVHRHWTPPVAGSARRRADDEILEAGRVAVDRAVADTLRARGPATLMLTGGLDSTAIAESATRFLAPGRLLAVTRKPGGATPAEDPGCYFDETGRAAQLAAALPGLDWHAVGDDDADWGESDARSFFLACAAPTRALHNIQWFYPLYRFLAGRGSRVTIGGEQGNSYFSTSGSWFLPSMFLGGQWKGLAREVRALGRAQGESGVRVFLRHIVLPLAPPSLRLRRAGISGDPWRQHSALSSTFAAETGFTQALDLDRYRMRLGGGHRSVEALRAWMWEDEVARDARGGMRAISGTDHRLPLADRRVVEFFGSLPADQFLRGGTSRYIARQILARAGTVPPETVYGLASGRQNGDWFERLSAQRPAWRTELRALRGRPDVARVVDLARIDALLEDWPSDAHAAEPRRREYLQLVTRGMEVAQFLAWHKRGNSE